METRIKDKIERLKVKAELFADNNIQAFIKTIQEDYYFCDILLVGDLRLSIYSFAGKRQGEKDYLFWSDIISIDEYKERGEGE